MLTNLGNIWTGCGCLFLLGIVVVGLLIGISRGGVVAVICADSCSASSDSSPGPTRATSPVGDGAR